MGCKSVPTRTGKIPEIAAPAAPAAPPVLVDPAFLGTPGTLNFIALNFSALNLSDGSRIAEGNVELQWNRGLLSLHSSPCSDIFESVFCIASGQYAKSQFD